MRHLSYPALALLLCACAPKVPAATTTNAPAETATAPKPAKEAQASSKEVKIPAQGLTLEGVLEMPAGEGPFPAVVLVHGSGPQSRDEVAPGQLGMKFESPVSIFADLAQQLAKQGVAVLRYDKRSCFAQNGCNNAYPGPGPNIVIQDFADDAKAALKYLAALPKVDPKKVIVVGHSQGAGLVPLLMQQMPELYAGVAMAPPGSSFAGTLRAQVEKSMSMVPEAQKELVKAQMKGLNEEIAKVEELEQGKELSGMVLGAPAGFMKTQVQAAKEALLLAKSIDRPIIALRGSYDWNIPEADFAEWKLALESSAHAAKHKVLDLPGLTHALNRIGQADPAKIQPSDIEPKVHPSVAEAIVQGLGL